MSTSGTTRTVGVGTMNDDARRYGEMQQAMRHYRDALADAKRRTKMPNSDQMHIRKGNDKDPRDRPPWYAWVVLAVLIVVFFVLVFTSWVLPGEAHEVDERYDPGPDSVKVQLEIDATNDGVWEVRHVFFDTLGVWDRSTSGMMRVTWTEWTWTAAGDSSRVAHTDYGYLWRDMFNTELDSMSRVLLGEFSQFGMAYGDTMTVLPDGVRMFESPGYYWYLYPKPEEINGP